MEFRFSTTTVLVDYPIHILGLIILLSPTDLLSDSGFPPASFVIAMLIWGSPITKPTKVFMPLESFLFLNIFVSSFPNESFIPSGGSFYLEDMAEDKLLWQSLHLADIWLSNQFVDYFGLPVYSMRVLSP